MAFDGRDRRRLSRLAGIDGTLPQVAKKRATVSTYLLKPSSYKRLCEHLGIVQPKGTGTP